MNAYDEIAYPGYPFRPSYPGRMAGALAPGQPLRCGEKIPTPLHNYIAVGDETARRLITLLDGTRDRGAPLEALGPRASAVDLEDSLAALARFGLLI